MGKVELEAKTKRRKTQVQRILLSTIATAGILSVGLVAPNALKMLTLFEQGKLRRKRPHYVVQTAFTRLLEKGDIVIEKTDKGKFVSLTQKGKMTLARIVARSRDTRAHARWDKRWRMVVYDIAEKRKAKRVRLRSFLRGFGFYKLQNSVWVYPYDTEELVTLLKADFKVGKEVLYVVVEHIENDIVLRKHFGIS